MTFKEQMNKAYEEQMKKVKPTGKTGLREAIKATARAEKDANRAAYRAESRYQKSDTNWGYIIGGLCFVIAGVLLIYLITTC